MDSLKRIGEYPLQDEHVKRSRQGDHYGFGNTPPLPEVQSRIILNKHEFSKVIGRGGQMIINIRKSCGAVVKGIDVDAELRMILISGQFRQVIDAFDMISELLYNSFASAATVPTEMFNIEIAVEHAKTGLIVGAKGATICSIKSKSGAVQIRVSKDPQDFLQQGQLLRVVHIEGSLQATRRAHFHILELFYDPSVSNPAAARGMSTMASVQNDLGSFAISPSAAAPLGPSGHPVPLSALGAKGVHQDVVRQLSEIELYINQYGLTLSLFEKSSSPSGQLVPAQTSRYSGGADPHTLPVDSRKMSEFFVPREFSGSIIGKGGVMLKELQQEYGCRIRLEQLEKLESNGMRKVMIWHDDDLVHSALKERIMLIVSTAADAGPTGAADAHGSS